MRTTVNSGTLSPEQLKSRYSLSSGTDLIIYYVFTYGRFGEAWTVYSWLQFGGMLLLFFGTAVYNGSVPWLLFPSYAGYERVEAGTEEDKGDARIRAQSIEDFAPVIRTDRSMVRAIFRYIHGQKLHFSSGFSRVSMSEYSDYFDFLIIFLQHCFIFASLFFPFTFFDQLGFRAILTNTPCLFLLIQASPALMRSPLIQDRTDPRLIRERGASLYGTPRAGIFSYSIETPYRN